MRMSQTETLLVTSASEQSEAAYLTIPITDINVSLIEKMRVAAAQREADDLHVLYGEASPYYVGVGDVLQITVWDHPELAAAGGLQQQTNTRPADPIPGFVVDNNGNLQFPYAGTLHVAGLEVAEIQKRITEALSRTFVSPQVTVRINSFRSKQIYVDGQVHTPGIVAINDVPLTLYEAINRAGGLGPDADQSRIELVRGGTSYKLNMSKMLSSGMDPSKISLLSGDLLRIPPRTDSSVSVMGEVNRPITAVPLQSGELTLSDAIAQAGSINSSTANAAQIYVIRGSLKKTPNIYRIDAHSPVAMLLANQFELQPKDIVYVDGSGLVRFNRVLTLLLPAINAGLTAAVLTK
ncbi:sugar ABC transporter substrate-binding protein [Trinickia violacea]|uniref:Sugar ABC transporter substrate-binding protein n=1 Tax=Trinickia violacea TaxID=2571746 RepID=A0A4P8J3C8_9BURK|nr:polysaccharide biosynthesis/export family protein [Trinickia violacea]QCP54985.1 sugar ABC transporter substrate-binding protein [Trinickia violacea]